ncbi:MAG TPA: glycine cleavage system protein GcvH [Candidatus Sumerlaeota bacterium]|nr:glycine cleavage system protein GcvH [Candidatus Sumerlaeota bacterium]HNM47924.1 glycine cleavage system protein GcvH [Candidatus Sumerlaeota bacterium]
MSNSANLLFSASHEWIQSSGDVRRVGITDHAQHLLGDIVYTDLPKVGRKVKKGEAMLVVESPKAAADVYAPLSGEVVEVNGALEGEPSKINQDPYGDGWLVAIRVSSADEAGELMSEADYKKSIGE